MGNFDRKKHWENIYQNKSIDEVSWYQSTPTASLDLVKQFKLPKTVKIIDLGGGDSFFVDHLLNLGYQDITVLDISEKAIERAKQRLGEKAGRVKWIITDAAQFHSSEKFGLWHDRATFHFLTDKQEIENYLDRARRNIIPAGYLVIGTFSELGPKKCSGIDIKQYSERSMTNLLKNFFKKIKCISIDHKTPFNTIHNFIFCSFRRLETI
jgi:SAM-dependent methyltransferase